MKKLLFLVVMLSALIPVSVAFAAPECSGLTLTVAGYKTAKATITYTAEGDVNLLWGDGVSATLPSTNQNGIQVYHTYGFYDVIYTIVVRVWNAGHSAYSVCEKTISFVPPTAVTVESFKVHSEESWFDSLLSWLFKNTGG